MLALLAAAATAGAQAPPRPAVFVAPAEISDLRPVARFSGRIVALQKVEIRARVAGVLEKVGFTEGSLVESGALLYEIEADPYEANVLQIKGAISAAEAQRDLAEIERQRKDQLVSRDTIARSELDMAIANLGMAEGEIMGLKGQLARAELDVGYTQVTAPFTGIVGLTNYDEGALVGPESGPLTTLTRLDPISVHFSVPTAILLRYRERQAERKSNGTADISLQLADGSTYPLNGAVNFIDAEVARGTDTVNVRAEFENPDNVLLDGALVSVSITSAEPRPVLNIPQRAVQRDQVGAYVLVVDTSDKVELRRVVISENIQGRSVVTGGLKEGEVVITDGVNKVRPGIEVDAATHTDG